MRHLFSAVALAGAMTTLVAQAPIGDPRWMPVDRMQGARGADGLAMEKQMVAFIDLVKALPTLNPPPGVYPKASMTFHAGETGMPHQADLMLGFWPPKDVAVRNGRLAPAGELSHLIVYVNRVRTESLAQDQWFDEIGQLYPQPKVLGEVQGFPVYQGFGSVEVSGILVILPEGESLFEPVTQERFRRFTIAWMEKRLKEYEFGLKAAADKYAAATSEEGKLARAARIEQSLVDYQKGRQRTATQIAERRTTLRKMDADEVEAMRLESVPESNRLMGPLMKSIARERNVLESMSADERASQACTTPDSRDPGPHPAVSGRGCTPIVSVRKWWDPALPRTAWQLVSIERYWSSATDVKRGVDRSQRNLPLHVNREVVEALDWKAFARTVLR